MSFNHYPHVYRPLDVGSMHLKNRIQYSPIVTNHAGFVDGTVTDRLFDFLEAQAKTGCALVTIGSSPVNFEEGRDYYGCLSITRDDNLADLKSIARLMHRHDCNVSVELQHAGQWASYTLLKDGKKAYVPSLVEGFHDPDRCKEMTREDMDQVIRDYVAAARRCKEAGFDMLMAHMAHGNLPSSFLSPAWNHRTDEYGGSLENRMRFPLEILKALHEVTNGDIPIEMRVVGNEWVEGGMPFEERIEFVKRARPYIDMVIVSAGTLRVEEAQAYNMPGYYAEPLLNVKYAAALKEACPDLVVSVCGGISTLDEAEEIIASGKADVVAMAKALMADEDFVNKGYRGQEADIRPCMRCLYCLRDMEAAAHLEGCAVNPIMGWEYRGTQLVPLAKRQKAMVIGGGPAGMEAARVLDKRNFEVVLYEKEPELGGRLPEASALPFKDGFRRYHEWVVRKTRELGIKITTGHAATPDDIRAEAPDVVVLAMGAQLKKPSIPGIDGNNVFDVASVDCGLAQTGKRVVVCGAGPSGAECALGLAMEGKQVTLVGRHPVDEFFSDFSSIMRVLLMKRLVDSGVELVGEADVVAFSDAGVTVACGNGERKLIEADAAVVAFGLVSESEERDALAQVVPETYIVGDARHPGMIGDAVNDAYWACRTLGCEA